MRRLLVLLFSTFILLSTASAASAVGGRGGGRRLPDDHQNGSQRSNTPPERERRPGTHAAPSPNTGLAPPSHAALKISEHNGLPTTVDSSSATIHLNTRLFQTVRKEITTTISLPTVFSPASDALLQEKDHNTLSKPHAPTSPATSTTPVPKNTTPPVYRLGAVFEPEHIQSLSSVFFQSLQEQNRLLGGLFRLEGVAIETPMLTLSSLKGTCETLQRENVSVGLAVGVTQSIYASGTLASLAGVSLIARTIRGYRDDTLKNLLPDLVVANPRLSDLWGAATSFISTLDWYQPILIHDDSPQALQLAHIASRDTKYDTVGLSLSANLPRHHFQNRLSGILHTVRRLIFVSGTVNFVKVVFSHGEDLDMFNGEYIWILLDIPLPGNLSESLRPGLLSLRPDYLRTPQRQLLINFVKSSISVISEFFKETNMTSSVAVLSPSAPTQCQVPYRNLSTSQFELHRQLKEKLESSRISQRSLPGVTPFFHVENLVKTGASTQWKRVGYINGSEVQINAIFWPGRGYKGVSEQNKRLRVALAEAPPFVMTSSLIENATCLLGIICLRVFSPEVAATFADMEREVVNASRGYEVVCCSGLSVDLMINVATDLEIELQVYLVMDGTFGAPRTTGWTGIVGDLLDGSADLSFAPLSVTAQRARHLDFSDPYFFSSMSILSSTKQMEVPLLAFLVPFSPELWIAIFVSLNITAFSVAVYEWLSPFGLNPWGRQRSKNFSYGSALWVIWGLLFSHLVAFKAPKSWPNKVLINVWGAFSVIFVASYTANIAALFAGLFQTRDHHGRNIMSLRVGSVRASSAEYYVSKIKPDLWEHMKPNLVNDFTNGLQRLRSGTLDLMVGDSAVLDYLRANDPGCTLARHGEDLVSDTFAISMGKGFPLRVKINTILARYLASGHLDHLKHKWYGELPCFNRISADLYKPQALEISTVGGVFLMLTLGIGVGIFLLFLEHLVYRYALPTLRTKPKESVWRNRNLMFFSQKLYKFINCVELVSPHHSAKELANSLRTGQIMGLFQKSVKRKENEQRRRRKSKAQFFEMIQEIRRVQKEERAEQVIPPPTSATSTTVTEDSRRGEPTPLHPPEATPAPPSPFSTTTTATTQAPITIDYLPGPNPHEDSEGIIVVNSSVPLGLVEELTSKMGHEDVEIEEDSSSGILILKVSDPEEALEANTFNQQLEDTQTYKLQDTAGECGVCTCSVQEGGVTRRKESGGCLNCLQRQDSARIARRAADGTCYPCSTVASARENPLGAYPIMAGTANGLRHRGSVPNPPTSHLPSPSLRPATAPSTAIPSPGIMQQADVPEILGHATRSLEDLEARTRHSLDEKSYERVRLLPLSQQTAIQSSGSLQLVAALSPGRERVNSDLLRHVSKADLWQLWQDSEKELRVRLRQAETQRDELLRQMSKSSHRDRHPLTEGSSEEWDSKSLEDTMGDAKQLYAAAPHVSRRVEDIGEFPRTGRRMSRERRPDETRLKTTRRDSSTTPRKKKRQRSKSQDYLETRKSTESLEEKKLYPKVEERVVTPRKHSSRRKRDGSQDRRTESEEGPTLQKQRPVVHCSFEGAIDRPDLVDPLGEYCSTPLPLLRSLHQQSKSDSERNYAFLQSLTPERRDERLPHDTYDHIHLKTFCREMKGRGCESDEQTEEDSRLKQSDEERLSIRRRRGLHHGVSGHVETQTRRPRERHPSREAYETPHRRESSLQKDTRQQLHRRPYEREAARDHTSPYSGSHRQQQPPPPLQQHGVRRHTTYDSSSDPEDPIYAAAQVLEAGSTREALGRRQPSHHPYPRAYEGRRSGDRMEDRRSSERKTFRETREPP